MYTSNPTTGTKHYVYLNGASLLSVACHNRINPSPFVLPDRHPTQLLFFLFLCFLCLVTSVVVPARFEPRHFHVVKVASPSSFFASRCTLEGHASPRTNTRTQEAIKSRNVFAWRRHVGRGESATTAVSSNGSFRARRRPPIGKELIAIIVLPILPLCVYRLAHVGLC